MRCVALRARLSQDACLNARSGLKRFVSTWTFPVALQRPDLLHSSDAYINGAWISAREQIAVLNPSNKARIGSVPALEESQIDDSIAAAAAVLPAWRSRPASERSDILTKWHALIREHSDDLAAIMTAENGKPLAESKGEVAYANSFIGTYAGECARLYGLIIPHDKKTRIALTRHAVGVVAAVTPWNFPAAMITRKVAAALAAGCPVVLKPSELTPFTALALSSLWTEAGGPPGTLNVVTGDAKMIGERLMADARVSKMTFTGSTRTGKILIAQSASTVKKLSMELGGNAPFIVFDDADIPRAISGAVACKFRNAGQTCVCANRIFVHERVYDEFVKGLVAAVRALVVGDGFDKRSTVGPLINQMTLDKVRDHVADAAKKGGDVLCGGKSAAPNKDNAIPQANSGLFFEPTVIGNANDSMKAFEEETFGPAAFLYRFHNDDDVIQSANNTRAGLAAYAYTKSIQRIARLTSSEGLQYGMIGINTSSVSLSKAPFGGVKESGYGREGGPIGLDDYLQYQTVHIAVD